MRRQAQKFAMLMLLLLVACRNQAETHGAPSTDITVCLLDGQQQPIENQEFRFAIQLDDDQVLTSAMARADEKGCKEYSIGEFTSTYPQPFMVQVTVDYADTVYYFEQRPGSPNTVFNIVLQ